MDSGLQSEVVGDYCTLFPDVVFGKSLAWCCFRHDVAYGAYADKISADLELALCVSNAGLGWVGLLMLVGVTLFGWLFYPRKPKRQWRCR